MNVVRFASCSLAVVYFTFQTRAEDFVQNATNVITEHAIRSVVGMQQINAENASDEDDVVGKYSGTWKSKSGEKGKITLVLKRDGGIDQYSGQLDLDDTSDEIFGHAMRAYVSRFNGETLEASYSHDDGRMVRLVSDKFKYTKIGFEGRATLYLIQPNGNSQSTELQLDLEKQ